MDARGVHGGVDGRYALSAVAYAANEERPHEPEFEGPRDIRQNAARCEPDSDSLPQTTADYKPTKSTRRVLWFLLARLKHKDAWRTHLSIPQAFIASRLTMDRRSVIRALASLEAAGMLSRRHQPLAKGGRTADLIVLDRATISAFSMVGKCHIRNRPKCHIRSSTAGSRKDPIGTSVPTGTATEGTSTMSMQGELFVGRGGKPQKPIADNAPSRLKTFQRLYRAKYGHVAPIASVGAAMKMIKTQQAFIASPELWTAVVDVYLREADAGVVEAEHPLGWLPRRLPAILPKAQRQVVDEARIAQVEAQNAAKTAQRTDGDERRMQYPGIRDGETVEAWQARRTSFQARRRAEGAKRWA